VSAGSALEHCAQVTGVLKGAAPLSAPIWFRDRLAHQHLDKAAFGLPWKTGVRKTPVLLRIVVRL
jgi:hypothetical protein